jgi:general secretion pathway protein G
MNVRRRVRTRRERDRRRQGFTLMEVLLVLVILVMIGSIAVTALSSAQKKASVDTAKTQIKAFDENLEFYRLAVGDYPTTSDGLQALIQPPASADTRWQGPYLKATEIPLDPWGRPYQYAYPGQNNPNGPDVWSAGPDRNDGTDDDVANWMP